MRLNGAGVAAVLLGATGIGLAPILVRLSEAGPVATAFHRIFLAQPLLWIWWFCREREEHPVTRRDFWMAMLAGFFFAGDLALWHWSIKLTTVANSTFFTNFAPLFVMAGAHFFFKEAWNARLAVGMCIALAGGSLLVAESLEFDRRRLLGDALAVVTALFYAGYLLCVKSVRGAQASGFIMAFSGLASWPLLLAIAAGTNEVIMPESARGWWVVIVMALVSHIGGQGLIAKGLGMLPATVSSVLLMWQPVVAAALAWVVLNEGMTTIRLVGGAIIIAGILIGTWKKR